MTFAIGHVDGGTNAGRKIQKPAPKPWMCGQCPDVGNRKTLTAMRAYMTRCTTCGAPRP